MCACVLYLPWIYTAAVSLLRLPPQWNVGYWVGDSEGADRGEGTDGSE